MFAGKNKLINADFSIWQRASVSTSTSSAGYFADRWRYVLTGGASKGFTQSRNAFTAGTAPVSGYEGKYFYRIGVSTAGTGYTDEALEQPIEDVRTFAGQTITISFWAKASSVGTIAVTPRLIQNFGTGGSGSVTTSLTTQTVGNTWARYSATITVPAVTGLTISTSDDSALILGLKLPNNTTYVLDVWGVQIERGSVATSFTINGASAQAELASCQRYYYRLNSDATNTVSLMTAAYYNTTVAYGSFKLPVSMKKVPTVSFSGQTILSVYASGSAKATTVIASSGGNGIDTLEISCTTAAVASAGLSAFVRFAAASGNYIEISSEYF
jgi:hypothetical protein